MSYCQTKVWTSTFSIRISQNLYKSMLIIILLYYRLCTNTKNKFLCTALRKDLKLSLVVLRKRKPPSAPKTTIYWASFVAFMTKDWWEVSPPLSLSHLPPYLFEIITTNFSRVNHHKLFCFLSYTFMDHNVLTSEKIVQMKQRTHY